MILEQTWLEFPITYRVHPAGNLIIGDDGPGFAYDLTTYLTRRT